ncbi:MAG: hypothetical protein H6719_10545 [Sandaracinaceae bacterium]|nr:hypothetical protein [Sandaracinaceae bacterium]
MSDSSHLGIAALVLLAVACGGAPSTEGTTPDEDDGEVEEVARAEMSLYELGVSTGAPAEGSDVLSSEDAAARAHFEARRFEEAASAFLRGAAAVRAAADADPEGTVGRNREWTCKNAAVAYYNAQLEAEGRRAADELEGVDPACAAAIRAVIPEP